MEDVTIEIVTELRDEASRPLKSLTGLTDRFGKSLDEMRAKLAKAGLEAAYLSETLRGIRYPEVNAAPPHPAGTGKAVKTPSASGSAAVPDTAELCAAMGNLASALADGALRTSGGLEKLAFSLETGASGSVVSLGGLSEALNAGSQTVWRMGESLASMQSAMAGALGAASQSAYGAGRSLEGIQSAAQSAAGGMARAGSYAQTSASQLRELGAAASALRSRFAGLRMPTFAAHASGGIMASPHLGMVAEKGPEAIIPLSGANRAHSAELVRQAGRRLGIHDMRPNTVNMGGVSVNIDVRAEGEPMQAIERSGARIADEVAQAIADGLEKAMRNMP